MNKLYLLFFFLTAHLSLVGQTVDVVDVIDFSSYETFPEVQFDGKKFLYLPEANLLIDKVANSTGNMLSVIKDGMYGAVDKNGKILAAFEYDDIDLKDEYQGQWYEGIHYDYEFIITKKQGKYGVINVEGHTICPPQYEEITIINRELIGIKQQGKWGWMTAKDGRIVQQAIYDEVGKSYLHQGGVTIAMGDKRGLAQEDGKVIIPPKYDFLSNIYTHSAAYVAYFEKGLYGVLDQSGKVITPPLFESLESMGDVDLMKVKQGAKIGAIDPHGNWVIRAEFDKMEDFVKGLALVTKAGKQAVVDDRGKLLVPFGAGEIEFQNAIGQRVFPAFAAVMLPTPGGTKLSDAALKQQATEKAIAALPYTIYVRQGEQEYRFDWSGQPIFPRNKFWTSSPFMQGGKAYYRVCSKNLYGVYDATGKEILPIQYHVPADQSMTTTNYSGGETNLPDLSSTPVYDGEKLGVFDLLRKTFIVPIADQRVRWISKQYMVVSRKRKDIDYAYETALYSSEGKCIKDFDAEVYDIHDAGRNLFLLEREDQSFQLMDSEGHIVYKNIAWRNGIRPYGFDLPANENPDASPFESGLLKINGELDNLFIDLQGKEKQFMEYTAVGSFYKGLAFVMKKTGDGIYRYGVINKEGKEIIPLELEQVTTLYGYPDLLLLRQHNRCGLWSRKGEFVLNIEYDDIEMNSSQSYVRIVKDGKKGLATKEGKIVIPPKYEDLSRNYQGEEDTWPVLVKDGEWYRLVNKQGVVYPIKAHSKNSY